MSRDGLPGCRCVAPRINIAGLCVVCGLEKLHVLPKTPFVTSWLPQSDADEAGKVAA